VAHNSYLLSKSFSKSPDITSKSPKKMALAMRWGEILKQNPRTAAGCSTTVLWTNKPFDLCSYFVQTVLTSSQVRLQTTTERVQIDLGRLSQGSLGAGPSSTTSTVRPTSSFLEPQYYMLQPSTVDVVNCLGPSTTFVFHRISHQTLTPSLLGSRNDAKSPHTEEYKLARFSSTDVNNSTWYYRELWSPLTYKSFDTALPS
jgi:hypothetical protein